MRRFDYAGLEKKTWDNEIVNYLSLIHEYKGKRSVLMQQQPEPERLIEIAKVQSTEASNSIEGIRTTETRLRQLMNERTTPRNRDEKEIAGYRDFDDRLCIVSPSSLDTVKNAINSTIGTFTKRDTLALCPSLSASTVERHLKKLTAEQYIVRLGSGKNTCYVKVG